jgi:hypothetical protein
VIVGIRPDVAIAMVHFDIDLHPLRAALDLEAGLVVLDVLTAGPRDGG